MKSSEKINMVHTVKNSLCIFSKRKRNQSGKEDLGIINRHPVVIIGLGSIGLQLAEQLVKLGVLKFILIGSGVIKTADVDARGFHDDEIGMARVYAAADRLQKIRGTISVRTHISVGHLNKSWIPRKATIFVAGCASSVRRQAYRELILNGKLPCLFDIRADSQGFQCFCVPNDVYEVMHSYAQTLHACATLSPKSRAGTTYIEAMAAGAACAMFKQWATCKRGGLWHSRFEFNVRTFCVITLRPNPKPF